MLESRAEAARPAIAAAASSQARPEGLVYA